MDFSRRRPIFFLTLVLMLLLVACGATVPAEPPTEQPATAAAEPTTAPEPTEPPAPTNPPAPTDAPAPTDVPATAEPTDAPTEAPVDDSAETDTAETTSNVQEDDRPSNLRSLTSTWGTNFAKRNIEWDEILSGGPPRDGIPSIDEPTFISFDEANEWLVDVEPVVAVEFDGEARAYPLQVLTWHEIVNDTVGETPIIVTFCPLCNSAIVFDRRVGDQTFEFGTSGLLRNSDLIMYDRTTETLWQQFTGVGIVGDLTDTVLTFLPSSLISYADFKMAYADGVVLSRDTGFNRRYGSNPYGGYDNINGSPFLFDGDIDGRLPAMERVVTVPLENADVAYPLSILSEMGVIHDTQGGQDMVVFHTSGTTSALGASVIAEAEDVGATGVFDPNFNGQKLTFTTDGETFTDDQTGSTWNIVGQAIAGELEGEQLTRIISADHFWFSWAVFRPDTVVYSN